MFSELSATELTKIYRESPPLKCLSTRIFRIFSFFFIIIIIIIFIIINIIMLFLLK